MNIEGDIFKKYTPDFKKLAEYGFTKNKTAYFYEKVFDNNEFKAVIEIKKDGTISGKVYDLESNEEYLPLKVTAQKGAFVGEIREEYKNILTDIRNNCFSKNYFVSAQANRIAISIISKYGDVPEYLWKDCDYGVFRNAKNKKWYGIIMDINYSKLGEKNKPVDVINIKLDKEEIQTLLKQKGFYPAWHMNKKSWLSIPLDETHTDTKILNLIAESYSYTIK